MGLECDYCKHEKNVQRLSAYRDYTSRALKEQIEDTGNGSAIGPVPSRSKPPAQESILGLVSYRLQLDRETLLQKKFRRSHPKGARS